MMVHLEQSGRALEGNTSGEREPIERQIAATDKKIDELVRPEGSLREGLLRSVPALRTDGRGDKDRGECLNHDSSD